MKTNKKIEMYFSMIESIKYENEHGGAYAYIQYMAYTRELIKLLRNTKKVERQLEAIEATNWLFNECLPVKFSYTNKIVFENKMRETKEIFSLMRFILNQKETIRRGHQTNMQHAQAA